MTILRVETGSVGLLAYTSERNSPSVPRASGLSAMKTWLVGRSGLGLLACPLERMLNLLFFVTQSSCSAFGSVAVMGAER